MMSSSTQREEREQWRARILRALAELQSDAPAVDQALARDEVAEGDVMSSGDL